MSEEDAGDERGRRRVLVDQTAVNSIAPAEARCASACGEDRLGRIRVGYDQGQRKIRRDARIIAWIQAF
jgi:hypothetical protein